MQYLSSMPYFWLAIILTFYPNYFSSTYALPQNTKTFLLYYLAKSTTPLTNFPFNVCLSTLPSPVTTISDYLIRSRNLTISKIVWVPLTIYPLKKTTAPAPNPPAAPDPFTYAKSFLNCLLNTLFKFIIPYYSFLSCC